MTKSTATLEIIMKSPKDLIPYEQNNKEHDPKQVQLIADSIKEFWFKNPIIIDKENVIVAGHGRLLGAEKLWLEQVPCILADDLDDEQIRKYRLLDNRLADLSEYNLENLKLELLELKDEELNKLFVDFKLELEEPKDLDNESQDDIPETPKESLIQSWDLFQLGDHFLLCGDATDPTHVEVLMQGEQVDLIITDPPYNVNYEGSNGKKIQNDHMDGMQFGQFLLDAYTNMYCVAKDGAGIYVFHADTEWYNFRKWFMEAGFKLSQCLVRVKQSAVMGRQDYHRRHEPILYGRKDTASHHWYTDRKQNTVREFNKPTKNEEHPTMKPIDLLCYPIMNSSQEKDAVLDLFAGSGSTLIASEKCNRRSYNMELDPIYAEVIIKRFHKYTKGKQPITCLTRELELDAILK